MASEPTSWKYIKYGARNHPGTMWLVFFVVVAWAAVRAWWAPLLMLAFFGPLWLWGAYSGGKVNHPYNRRADYPGSEANGE